VAVNTVQHDLRAYNLTLKEAVDLAQNHPLSVEADVYIWHYALLVVHARTEEEEQPRTTYSNVRTFLHLLFL